MPCGCTCHNQEEYIDRTPIFVQQQGVGKILSMRNALPKLPQPIKENLKHFILECQESSLPAAQPR
jgi:hypothetical protein